MVTLLVQAFLPAYRVLVVCSGAGLSCLASTLLGISPTSRILAEVPWDVLVILVTLGLVSQLFAESRLFDRLAVVATRIGRADPNRLKIVFAVVMYLVSGIVNNLTALVLVLPVLHVLLRLGGTKQRYVSWTLGLLLVACNLGGAATPIGDFPAILLLGRGSMTFVDYLKHAAPATAIALVVLLGVTHFFVRPSAGLPRDPVSTGLSNAVMEAMHRRIKLDHRVFVPAAASLCLMVAAWVFLPASLGIGPELVCWMGAALALVLNRRLGEKLVRNGIEAEAVFFLLSLFVMVVAVKDTGLFELVAKTLEHLPLSPIGQLFVFLLLAGVLTGLFSAGPSMAALLEVAESLAKRLPPSAVYVGLALSVCAGSSLFLTAATSGPLAQALTERADLRDIDGKPLRFGFFDFLPTGLLAFAIIELTALAYAAWVLS
ncbi:MAG: permease [Polyangiaceae bacterium]|nr:permease [Polyangiaceae bacterium]